MGAGLSGRRIPRRDTRISVTRRVICDSARLVSLGGRRRRRFPRWFRSDRVPRADYARRHTGFRHSSTGARPRRRRTQLAHAPAPIVRTLVACGAAAGISATFNAPIGGVFFASEVILGDFAPRSFATIVVSSVIAAVISRAYLGNRPSFSSRLLTRVAARTLALCTPWRTVCAVGVGFRARALRD